MTDNNQEMLKSMNATTILIAILNQIGSISVPTKDFLEVNSEDRQLSVEYDSDTMSFNFKMKDTVEDTEVEDLDNAPEDYKLTGRIY
jgi:hypothetical protein